MAHTRRDFLQFGTVALGGLSLAPAVSRARSPGRARACILLYMDGGPSHIDLWDMKPEAPEQIRGPFRSCATSVPGIRLCEHLPRVARQMHLVTQVRSVVHTESVHDPAVYQMLTGCKHISSAGGLTVQPTDHPHMGSAFGQADRSRASMPKVIEVPETMKMEARVLPGQNAGILGPTWAPLRVNVTPSGQVEPPEFHARADVPRTRRGQRATLLQQLDHRLSLLEAPGSFDAFRQQALDLLDRPSIHQAFDLEREPAAVRETYGQQRHGQSVLLARRLVEAGARFVTVYWGREPQDWADGRGLRSANNPWDTHRNHFPLVQDNLLPRRSRPCRFAVRLGTARAALGNVGCVDGRFWPYPAHRPPLCQSRSLAARQHGPVCRRGRAGRDGPWSNGQHGRSRHCEPGHAGRSDGDDFSPFGDQPAPNHTRCSGKALPVVGGDAH